MNCIPTKWAGANGLAFRPPPPRVERAKLHGIKAALSIPGRGKPIKDGAVIIHEDKIAFAGPQSSIPAKFKAVPFTDVPVIMPGLWDCHVHFFGEAPGSSDYAGFLGNSAQAGARITKDLERTLLAGFTSVREVGGYAGEVAVVVEEGTIIGPNIYSSIAPISMTGGHGDIHQVDLGTVLDASAHGIPLALCDGVPECIKTVRKMIRRGAKVIKICATGGVGSLLGKPHIAIKLQFYLLEAGCMEAVLETFCPTV